MSPQEIKKNKKHGNINNWTTHLDKVLVTHQVDIMLVSRSKIGGQTMAMSMQNKITYFIHI